MKKANGTGPVYFFSKSISPIAEISPDCKIAIFLDFDGTLVPIQKDPARCVLSRETKEQLRSLGNSSRHFVTVLSGRALSDIKEKAGIRDICYGGNHGLVISGKGMRFIHPEAARALPVIDKAARTLNKEIASFAGVWIENKKYSLSLHYRLADGGSIPRIKKIFRRVAEEFSWDRSITVMSGKKVLELIPNISWDKGHAALWILSKLQSGYLPIFIGDDVTDETAFKAFENRGITVRIGRSKMSLARYYLKNYRETRRLLEDIGTVYPIVA